MRAPVVTLLTDFGLRDSYVAEVKAVLLTARRELKLIDISHEIAPHDVKSGAFQLLRSYRWFPPGTVHLAVVDPGVGTDRKAIYVNAGEHHFVGPDNGLLKWAAEHAEACAGSPLSGWEIPPSRAATATFHGRDIFAPFVVTLLDGLFDSNRFAPVSMLNGRSFPDARSVAGKWSGEVISVDHFGNLVTSIPLGEVAPVGARVSNREFGCYDNYLAIPQGEVGLIKGSHGFWEIAAPCRSASHELRVGAGAIVEVLVV